MNEGTLNQAVFITIVILFSLAAGVTFYCFLAGFYLLVNPPAYNLFHFLRDHWRRVVITFVPLILAFWFTASMAAVFCGVKQELYQDETGFYFHKMSLFLPKCGTVGTWAYGSLPPRTVPGLTFGLSSERVILSRGLALYLAMLCIIIAWVGNYVVEERRKKRRAKTSTKES